MMLSRNDCNLLGGITALLAFASCDALLLARVTESPEIERGFGLIFLGLCVPALYLLFAAFAHRRRPVYFVWLLLFLAFLVVEALLDFVLHVPFRQAPWQVVLYVALFFGGLGGMVGLASRAGRRWTMVASVGFLSTAVLAFVHYGAVGL
jgi:hypothetical protein